MLYDVNSDKFDLDNSCDDESKTEFRFYKNVIFQIKEVLRIPEELYGYNIVNVHGTEALCMFRNCFNGLCCDLGKVSCFETNKYVYLQNDYVSYMRELFYIFFADSNQQWLPPEFLSSFADEVPRKEVPLQRCWVLLMALCVLFVDHSKSKNYLSWA